MKKSKEQDLVKPCLELLALRGVFAWRVNSAGVRMPKGNGRFGFYRTCSVNGVSDILGVLPDGRFLAVELKRKGGKVRDSQKEFLGEVAKREGLAVVVKSVGELADALSLEGY